jgi:hypothetical protein
MEFLFEETLGFRGRRMRPGWNKTPFSQLFAMQAGVEKGMACVFYVAAFPFEGSVGQCADGTRPNSLRFARGVVDRKHAQQITAAALQEQFGLSTTNAEHIERPYAAFDLLNEHGEWIYRFSYNGPRRFLPSYIYDVDVRVDGTTLRASRRVSSE